MCTRHPMCVCISLRRSILDDNNSSYFDGITIRKRMVSETTVAANETKIVNETFDSFRIRCGRDSFSIRNGDTISDRNHSFPTWRELATCMKMWKDARIRVENDCMSCANSFWIWFFLSPVCRCSSIETLSVHVYDWGLYQFVAARCNCREMMRVNNVPEKRASNKRNRH